MVPYTYALFVVGLVPYTYASVDWFHIHTQDALFPPRAGTFARGYIFEFAGKIKTYEIVAGPDAPM